MNAQPSSRSRLCIYMLSITGLCLGCRLPQDLVLHRSDSVSQRQEKSPAHTKDVRSREAATRPTATNVKVSETESMVQKKTPEQSPSNAWASTSFETHQVATDPSVGMPMSPSQVATPDSTTAQSSAPTETSLALASYSSALPTSTPEATLPDATKATEKASEANLELHIENVRPQRGMLKVAVFTDAENFLNPNFVSQAFELKDDAATASIRLSIDSLCAIAVFQDLDGNGQLTKNRLGIPVEPCAFSNNAVIKRGPPKFSEAMVQPAKAAASPTRVSIRLP